MPREDAKIAFDRERRRRVLARLASRLRFEADDVSAMLPFDEVVAALGATSRVDLGEQVIPLDSIVGTVDRGREFDRSFRPTSSTVRPRWERIAAAQRRGEAMPPIDVYRIGDLHFVKDGHHRVSVARALGNDVIDAYVTEVQTVVEPGREVRPASLPLRSHERVFYDRVPLPPPLRKHIKLSHPEWQYAALAEGVEAWGFRVIQGRGELMSREEVAQSWFHDEYLPVVEMLREADLVGNDSETEAYMRVASERYLLLRTHVWDDAVIERLRRELR